MGKLLDGMNTSISNKILVHARLSKTALYSGCSKNNDDLLVIHNYGKYLNELADSKSKQCGDWEINIEINRKDFWTNCYYPVPSLVHFKMNSIFPKFEIEVKGSGSYTKMPGYDFNGSMSLNGEDYAMESGAVNFGDVCVARYELSVMHIPRCGILSTEGLIYLTKQFPYLVRHMHVLIDDTAYLGKGMTEFGRIISHVRGNLRAADIPMVIGLMTFAKAASASDD